ncbi:phosphatidylinositol kinase- protein kinase tor1, partial [Nowakowskiella sp. JEL0078]
LKGCQRNVEVWHRILKVRAVVITPKEDMDMNIKFANLCRKSGRLGLSAKTLSQLLNTESKDFNNLDVTASEPQVIYACLKHLWASGERSRAFSQMRHFTYQIEGTLGGHLTYLDMPAGVNSVGMARSTSNYSFPGIATAGPPVASRSAGPVSYDVLIAAAESSAKAGLVKLLARCYLKMGEWNGALIDDLDENVIPDILNSYEAATRCDKNWYKAWHAWALANFEVLSYYEKKHVNMPHELIVAHVVPSVQGFFRSIALSKNGNSLQDTLRLLTLWFKYGFQQDVNVAIGEGFNNVSIDTWLQVIPQ